MIPLLDSAVIALLNHVSRGSAVFDDAVGTLAVNDLLKGSVLLAGVWLLWFEALPPPARVQRRQTLLAGLAACFLAMAVARSLAYGLPFRLRPLHDAASGVLLPLGMVTTVLDRWSSFPSDHAALYFCLAGALWAAQRRLGALALLHVTLVICLPRVYLGLHYATDILAGAAIGLAAAWLLQRDALRRSVSALPLRIEQQSPRAFNALLFLLSFEMVEQFNSLRQLGSLALRAARPWLL